MIIKSHIRGGYRAAAAYLQAQGENETVRLVGISDPDAHNLAEAFHNMWAVARHTKAKKPLHHISINPMADERLTDAQVMQIIERCAEKYGYQPACHQRVIVEHIKDGRQHFHVVWNRVSLATGKSVWPGCHWNKSKQVAREMERELGLKVPASRRQARQHGHGGKAGTVVGHKPRHGHMERKTSGTATRAPSLTYALHVTIFTAPIPVTRQDTSTPVIVMPYRPSSALSGMSEEQRLDFIAACEGKITWKPSY